MPVDSDRGGFRLGPAETAQLLSLIVAPTTAVAALLYYFGLASVRSQYRYFAIDATQLDLPVTEYLRRSVEPMFGPMTMFLTVTAAALWGHVVLTAAPRREPSDLRTTWLPVAFAVAGVTALARGLTGFGPIPELLVRYGFARPPLFVALGIVALAYAAFLRQRFLPAERRDDRFTWAGGWPARVSLAVVGSLVCMLLFWAMSDYAGDYGRSRAVGIAVRLDEQPAVTLVSAEDLHLDNPGVRREVRRGDGGTRYRYTGLRLLAWANDRYFLLPGDWSAHNPVTFVVPDDPSVRVELARGADRDR